MTLNPTNVNVTTAGAHTLTVAEVLSGFITRTGAPGAFVDTLPPTSDILSALQAQTPFVVQLINATSYQWTLDAGDAGTTVVAGAGMLGESVIPADNIVVTLVTPTGNTVTVTLLYPILNANN